MREAAQAHTEAYPAMEYRHGPISLAGPTVRSCGCWERPTRRSPTTCERPAPPSCVAERDPMAELILIQRAAVRLAVARGLDPTIPAT